MILALRILERVHSQMGCRLAPARAVRALHIRAIEQGQADLIESRIACDQGNAEQLNLFSLIGIVLQMSGRGVGG